MSDTPKPLPTPQQTALERAKGLADVLWQGDFTVKSVLRARNAILKTLNIRRDTPRNRDAIAEAELIAPAATTANEMLSHVQELINILGGSWTPPQWRRPESKSDIMLGKVTLKRIAYAALAVAVIGVGALIWAAQPTDEPDIPITPAVTCGDDETVDPATGECVPPQPPSTSTSTTPPADLEGDIDLAATDLGKKPHCGKCLVPCWVGSHHDCNSCNDHECSASATIEELAPGGAWHWPGCSSAPFCWPPEEILPEVSSYPDWPWCCATGDCGGKACLGVDDHATAAQSLEATSGYGRCLSACLDTLHCGSYDKNRVACGQACQRDPHQINHPWGYYCNNSSGVCAAATDG